MRYLLASALFLVVSCSQQKSPLGKNSSPVVDDVSRTFEAKITNPSEQNVIDFGSVLNDSNKTLSLTIRNVSDNGEILNGPASLPSESDFSIISSNCSNVKPKSSCSIRMLFDAKNKSTNTYSEILMLDELAFVIQIDVEDAPIPALIGSVASSEASFDMGVIQIPNVASRVIEFTNNTNKTLTGSVSVSSTLHNSVVLAQEPVSKVSDSCSAPLSPKQKCRVRIVLNAIQEMSEGQLGIPQSISGQINYTSTESSASVSFTASVVENEQVHSTDSQMVLLSSLDNEVNTPLNLGSIPSGTKKTVQLRFQNQGTGTARLLSPISVHPSILILSNSCSVVKPKGFCAARILISSTTDSQVNANFILDAPPPFPFYLTYNVPVISASPFSSSLRDPVYSLTEGNYRVSGTNVVNGLKSIFIDSFVPTDSGKFYFEVEVISSGFEPAFIGGQFRNDDPSVFEVGNFNNVFNENGSSIDPGLKIISYNNSLETSLAHGTLFDFQLMPRWLTNGNIVGVSVDFDNDVFNFNVNGNWSTNRPLNATILSGFSRFYFGLSFKDPATSIRINQTPLYMPSGFVSP